MDFSDLIQWCLEHLSYWVILILMILENSLVPLPSELIGHTCRLQGGKR